MVHGLRERTNSTNKLLSWIKDSLGVKDDRPKSKGYVPIRATSTPHKNAPDCINETLDISMISAPQTDFAELGAYGPDRNFGHPDLDNDITTYCFHTQALCPNTGVEWEMLGGEPAYRKLILFVYDLYVERPMPREVLHLAIYYIQTFIKKEPVAHKDLEDAGVAAVNLAAKVERQHGFRFAFLEEYNLKNLFIIEKKICQAVDFHLWPTTLPFFMRLLNNIVCVDGWHWKCAKCLAELMICGRELVEIPPALAAGVVLRLVSKMGQIDRWNDNCYAIIQHQKYEYDRPHILLCSLILSALESPKIYEPIFWVHEDIVRILESKRCFFEEEMEHSIH